jgi:small subunit ribosomal protein S3
MEERKIVQLKKEEFSIKEYIKSSIGKGKISKVKIEYTPIGEKVIISTNRPGLVIGKRGERIDELTNVLRKRYKMENPHIEIDEIIKSELDSQLMADEIALGLERFGPLRFKVIAYRTLQKIMAAGALGVELRLSGKLPSSRARTWRFTQGYLKKTGHSAKVVDIAKARAETKPGTVGVKVSILKPDAILLDRITIDEEMLKKIRINMIEEVKPEKNKIVNKKATKKKAKGEEK